MLIVQTECASVGVRSAVLFNLRVLKRFFTSLPPSLPESLPASLPAQAASHDVWVAAAASGELKAVHQLSKLNCFWRKRWFATFKAFFLLHIHC